MRRDVKKIFTSAMVLTLITCMMTGCSGGTGNNTEEKKSLLDPKNPTTITVWNYYNGDQLAAFEKLVSTFNDTVGVEEGIVVVPVSQGSVENLSESLIDSINGKAGAQDVPSLAAVYADTAFILNEQDSLAPMDEYFSEDELDKYVPSFIEEGRFVEGGKLMLFPVSKSTECFAINETDWAEFEGATGVTIESVNTIEALTEAAQKYYEWTDGLTPDVKNDGKALYGRDSVANYVYVGTKELGHEIFKVSADKVTVDMDKGTFRKLWDNYYIPTIKGYFTEVGNYRSEDMKTGEIIALTGSTSSASYLPTTVTLSDDSTHDINVKTVAPLSFENCSDEVAVQQGAGYCMLKSDEKEQYASAEFLKWFTESERNIEFSVESGYSPVMKVANDTENIKKAIGDAGEDAKKKLMTDSLLVSSDVFNNKQTYTCKPFEGGKDLRYVLGDAFEVTAKNDRASVVEKMKSGVTYEEAIAEYTSDEYFDKWFNELCNTVNAAVK